MSSFRHLRVGKLIQEELGTILAREFEFEAVVTITEVEVARGLETAKVKIGVFPESAAGEALETLEHAKRRLQHLLLKRINIKPMPRISFEVEKISADEDNKRKA